MMELTPLDVRKKKEDFRRSVRGYDASQVDAFLDLVADRLETLMREQGALNERVESLRQQLSHYQERERALNEALLTAQELREEARSQSERDAAVRLREAETHAEAILLEADQAIRHSQRRLEDIQARRTALLRSFRGLLDRFADYVQVEQARLEGEPAMIEDLLDKLEGEAEVSEAETDVPAAAAKVPGAETDVPEAAAENGSDLSGEMSGASPVSPGQDAEAR